ncbi:EipB family protein [Novispirillum sp. DQ9]|uniref:EipB family protein n=1 Tax=Novispirillum sp. DQ9 TaxID=3398612 RepID=UPI003C79BBCD
MLRAATVVSMGLGAVFALAVAAPSPAVARGADGAAHLVSHRASYDMRLATTRSSSGIVGAGGTMNYTFTDGCDGWTVETRTDLTMMQAQGGPLETSWDFLAWESKDGKSYRFRVRNTRDSVVIEAYDGTATVDEAGGRAVFNLGDGEEKVIDLPAGTLLPTEHTQELVRKARGGAAFVSAPVFDGSGVKGAYLVTAGLGKELPANRPHSIDAPALLGGAAWPMTLAFFSPDSPDSETPDFEVSLHYHANGIAENLTQDFGDFALRGILRTLEKLPTPDC